MSEAEVRAYLDEEYAVAFAERFGTVIPWWESHTEPGPPKPLHGVRHDRYAEDDREPV